MVRIRSWLLMPMLTALGSVCVADSAGATPVTINFSPLTPAGSGFNNAGNPYSQDDFTFTGSGGAFGIELGAFQSNNTDHPVGGSTTTSLTSFFAGTTVTMTPTLGGTFNLQFIDLAQWGANQGGGSVNSFPVTFTGTKFGGGTVVQTFTVPNVSGSPVLDTYDFSGFTDLTQIALVLGVFDLGSAWQFDNIVSAPPAEVPEPWSMIILLAAIHNAPS